MEGVETQIAEWRAHVAKAPAVNGRDVDELEDHLRNLIDELSEAGLTSDEAFLVAVKRMGELDVVSREFARVHSGRLWKQLFEPEEETALLAEGWLDALVLAIAAAVAIQVARLAAGFPDGQPTWFERNLGLLVLPFLAAYFARRRQLDARGWLLTAAPFALAALVINLYPYDTDSDTEILVALHLPVVLWFVVAFPYMGGTIRSHERRMDFVRFTGEWFIYYVLIALGGGVLMALTAGILQPTGVDVDRVAQWVMPSGAAGAVVVAAWLVESKQRVIENMAPVLSMLFTPLFAVMLACAAVVYAVTGLGDAFDRELVSVFDALLLVVLGLVLYGLSAREPSTSPSSMDAVQLIAVGFALLLDVLVLGAMIARIGDLGFTPNRTAALGLNLVLLGNLAGAAFLSARFLGRRSTLHRLERWQTAYLPVFALWAAAVVVVLPPLFGFS
ncbi:MAG: permease prefix domain 1-containing protein [Gaiella sp.]|jgi:FtsH-binding integral membrane protein|uniref:permease prefix domain 1-containing protein n=1 Tax=Gaiella sp. TaxID=2663207 RepID=UPI003C74E863